MRPAPSRMTVLARRGARDPGRRPGEPPPTSPPLPGPGNGGTTNIGYFITGTGQSTFVPVGSVGPICVAPGIRRFLPPVNMTSETIVFHAPFNGTATTDVAQGFSRAVLGAGATEFIGVITAGSRWNFQAWHRGHAG